jgi:hypothetical protein
MFDHLSRVGEQTMWQSGVRSNFLLRFPGKVVCEMMDCLAMLFVYEFSTLFNTFCYFAAA